MPVLDQGCHLSQVFHLLWTGWIEANEFHRQVSRFRPIRQLRHEKRPEGVGRTLKHLPGRPAPKLPNEVEEVRSTGRLQPVEGFLLSVGS